MYYNLPLGMEADFTPLKMLLSQLRTTDVARAEARLFELCNSERGLERLYLILAQDHLTMQAQTLIVSLINRLILEDSKALSSEFTQSFLMSFVANHRIVRKHKLAISRSLSYCISRNKNFQKTILSQSKKVIDNLSVAISENLLYEINIKEKIINQSTTFIALGHSTLSVALQQQSDDDSEEESPNKKGFLSQEQHQMLLQIPTAKYVAEFLVQLQQFHACINKLQNITDFIDVFQSFFELLLLVIEQSYNNKLMRMILRSISTWAHFSKLFLRIYIENIDKIDRSNYSAAISKKRELQYLKYEVSLFHTAITQFLLQSNDGSAISVFLDPFLPVIFETIVLYNPMVRTEGNKLCESFSFLLEDYYLHSKQTSIEEMMNTFISFILPLLDRILVSLRGIHFVTEPRVLYDKLQEMYGYQQACGSILNSLVEIVKHFVMLDDNFSIFLFQLIRRSFQINYLTFGKEEWDCPGYITDNDAASIKAYISFFIMSMLQFSPQIKSAISEYYGSILSVALIKKLDEYSCGIMYFFLEHYYIDIYSQSIQQGIFIFYYIFDENINSSTELFANQFIYNMSDTMVDIDFIIHYVQKISSVRDIMKWKILQKWMDFYKDYSKKSNIRLALCLIQSTKSKINEGDCQELRQYLSILAIVFENLIAKEKLSQLISHFLELCYILVDRSTLEPTKRTTFCLLRMMLKRLPQGEAQMFEIIQLVLEDNNYSHSADSNGLYLLVASSLKLFTKQDTLLTICKYVLGFLAKVKTIPTVNQNGIDVNKVNQVYQQLSNALFLLQGYLAEHSELHAQLSYSIMLKVSNLKEYLTQSIRLQQLRNQFYWIVYSRCIAMEVYFCALHEENSINFDYLERQAQGKIFKDYEAMILLESLMLLYPRMLKQSKSKVIYIVRNILAAMMLWQKKMDNDWSRRKLIKKFYLIPNKLSLSVVKSKNALASIRRWMDFLGIADWREMSEREQFGGIPYAVLEEMRGAFKILNSWQIKRQRSNRQVAAHEETTKKNAFKRSRPKHFDEEQSHHQISENSSRESFRKIRKVVLEHSQSTPPMRASSLSFEAGNYLLSPQSLYQQNSFIQPLYQSNQGQSKESPQIGPKQDSSGSDCKIIDKISLLSIQNPFEKDRIY